MSTNVEQLPIHYTNRTPTLGIRGRLLIGFIAIAFILMLLVGVSLTFITNIKNSTHEVIDLDLPTYDAMLNLGMNINHSQALLQKIVLTKDQQSKTELTAIWDNNIVPLVQSINNLKKNGLSSQITEKWNAVVPLIDKFKNAQEKLINADSRTPNFQNLLNEEDNYYSAILTILDGNKNSSGVRHGGIFEAGLAQLHNHSTFVLDHIDKIIIIEYSLSVLMLIFVFIIAFFTIKGIVGLAKKITEACHNMVSSLDEVQHTVDMQSSGATEQAASINEITASLEEIEKSSTQTMEKAQTLGEVAERTRQKGQLGLESVEQSIAGMKAVRDKVQSIAQTILNLSNQTQQVGEITGVVNTLAQQSKMLALNASIEAAKAGEAGKGFAVVASEVKNLAEQSEQSTIQVQKILENIRQATEKAVMVTEEGTKGVDQGTELVEQTGEIVRNLTDVIHEATIASQQIEAAVRQETVGLEQITAGMNEINKVTATFVESIHQTTEAIDNLSHVSKTLKEHVDTYKVS